MNARHAVRLSLVLATMSGSCAIACGGSSDAPAAPTDSGVAETATDAPEETGVDAGFALAPGQVLEVPLEGGAGALGVT
jgi:hypothetical protein